MPAVFLYNSRCRSATRLGRPSGYNGPKAARAIEGGLVNTRFLEEFLVLSEELSYSSAAERLFTTRPTLTEHMRSLEAELSC